jgi:mRNA-degrading endonuclease RelE of RelBE toxin-antitoxin system
VTDGYTVQVSSEAIRGLNRLPTKVAAAIVEFVTVTLVKNPQQLSKPLRGELEAYRSARRGDYRILIRIDEDERTVLVIRVDHRAHAYRPL